MKCQWSKDNVCQTIVHFPTAKPLICDGHHRACAGQVGKVRDIRDGSFQIPLLSGMEVKE